MPVAPVFPKQKHTAQQLAGLRYEKRALRRLASLYDLEKSPWLSYIANNREGICQPDGIITLNPTHVLVVEVKLSHVLLARQKLRDFYRPLVQALYPGCFVSTLQVFRNTSGRAHKTLLSHNDLDKISVGTYRECHLLL
jgi:hypothetical protein